MRIKILVTYGCRKNRFIGTYLVEESQEKIEFQVPTTCLLEDIYLFEGYPYDVTSETEAWLLIMTSENLKFLVILGDTYYNCPLEFVKISLLKKKVYLVE